MTHPPTRRKPRVERRAAGHRGARGPRRVRPGSPVRLALAAVALTLGACGAEADLPRSLYELERMAFVPGVSAGMPRGPLAPAMVPPPRNDLLVDRFEATRADLAWYGLESEDRGTWSLEASWMEHARDDWPASMSLAEAQQLAEQRGMRLLLAHEWIHIAIGPRRHKFPWGSTDQRSTANTLELGLGRPLPVGTFESGRSEPYGCYDLLGNVWEWVVDRVPGYADPPGDDRTPPWRVSAMGGSFLTHKRETYGLSLLSGVRQPVYHAVTLDPRHRAPDVGARCAVEAATWLREHAPLWSRTPGARPRLATIGSRWGADAEGLLAQLVAEPEAPKALEWLLEGARGAR